MTDTSVVVTTPAKIPFGPRGPLSEAVLNEIGAAVAAAPRERGALVGLARQTAGGAVDVLTDEDIQVALFALYCLPYGSLDHYGESIEWDPELIETRSILEARFEQTLRNLVRTPRLAAATPDAVASALFAMTADAGRSPDSLCRFIAKRATRAQAREFLVHRTVYTLREADPHSWAIPRLTGRAKAALVEIQADEYGSGDPDRVHATLFARAVRAAGLDGTYGAYIDRIPAITLASHNLMSMFGLNQRLRGAIVGHLAAYEMTSSIPCRLYADGLRRLGFSAEVTAYFDEHVEADAVHEQIAGRDLAGGLVSDEPHLAHDVLFGACAYLFIDGLNGDHMRDAWRRGTTSLLRALPEGRSSR